MYRLCVRDCLSLFSWASLPFPNSFPSSLQFWETIAEEHGLDGEGYYKGNNPELQLERIDVYFNKARYASVRSAKSLAQKL